MVRHGPPKIQKHAQAWLRETCRSNFSALTQPSYLAEEGSMLKSLTRSTAVRAVAFLIGFLVIGGCTLNVDVDAPAALAKVSGDGQSQAPNTALPAPFVLLVLNQFGERLNNVTVTWGIAAGGGSLSSNTSVTDETGTASVIYTTGPVAGQAAVRGRVHDVPPVTFNVTITP
jgi:hypothetical protein